jgi:hypothetical protein
MRRSTAFMSRFSTPSSTKREDCRIIGWYGEARPAVMVRQDGEAEPAPDIVLGVPERRKPYASHRPRPPAGVFHLHSDYEGDRQRRNRDWKPTFDRMPKMTEH